MDTPGLLKGQPLLASFAIDKLAERVKSGQVERIGQARALQHRRR